MRPVFMFPKTRIAICLYGLPTDTVDVNRIKLLCSSIFKFPNRITYFESFGSNCIYENLWISAFKKRQHELDSKRVFDVCVAIDASRIDILSELEIAKLNISEYREEKLYFVVGEYFSSQSSTAISPAIFFANSLIFDCVCNFGKVFDKLPDYRKAKTIEEDFYFFLKTLKIKTRCINYENSSLFKRST